MAHVKVPATSANLGAGFDCIGIAVDKYLTAHVTLHPELEGEISFTREGAGALEKIPPQNDYVYRGFAEAITYAKATYAGGAHFRVSSNIPLARGLGSSAAALVAGAELANEALALGLSRDDLLQICGRIEGHPDNVAPAIFGGAVLGVVDPGKGYHAVPIEVHPSLAFVFTVPSFRTETKNARSVLPPVIPFSRAVLALSRSAALVKGLETGDADLLKIALNDVIHVPYRKHLVSEYDEVVNAAVGAGAYGATLSGSGSTLVAIASRDLASEVCSCMKAAWEAAGYGCEAFVSDTHPVPGVALQKEVALVS